MKTYLLFLVTCLVTSVISAQDQVDQYIKEAQDFLANKQYAEAQLSLQDAINAINMLIAQEATDVMPDEINGLKADDAGASSSMGMMGGGFQLSKSYSNPGVEGNEADVNIIANSPMLSAMSMYLSNPTMMGPEYKSIRIGTQRAIMKSEMTDFYADNGTTKSIRSTEVQIPLNQTLITINLRGFESEAAELDFLNKLSIDKLKTALGE